MRCFPQVFTLLFGLFCLSTVQAQGNDLTSSDGVTAVPMERTCFAHEKHVQMMGLQKYAAEAERIEQHTAQWAPIVAQQRAANQNAVVTIPVVFHVVYRTATENISAEQIQSQLDVLNDDFRRLNSDVDDIWPQAADTEIEFCLASFDPQGNPTDGILRVPTTVSEFGTNDAVKSASSGGSDAWPYNEYLNFWVCNIGGGILGYAQFPGGSASTDGVVCGYQYTGTTGTATAPFDLGRTATHEVGHWLNLRHIWGDGGCGASDFVDDTPDSDGPNYGCALGNVACNTTDMVQNYMDYSDDACMNLFTQGQTDRMLALFQPGGFRAGLLESNGCAPPCEVSCGCTDDTACNFDSNALNDDGTCDFSCYGCTDAAACNYDPSATLDDGSCASGELQDFTFNLTPDNYGSETTWTLVDDGGSTVMSGGPYVNSNTTPISVSANLGAGCYTLTVNDSYGDGICCQYGSGDYSFTVCGEVVASGATFTNTDVSTFCVEPTNVAGCTDSNACNYNPSATTDDGSCLTEDACGICGGPGAIYDCGCADIPAGDCDCNGNQLDECGECGGGGIPAGDCDCNGNQLDALGICGGTCTADADSDGICDDVDTCVGTVDECGVCNGPGIPTGDCDCNGNQLDALDICGGDCAADDDNDGICDDVDDCVGTVDECGVCNGPGIPAGDCDCNGNQLDALGVCGGGCTADEDSDGICDDVDDCVGQLDALGVCNGNCPADLDGDGVCDNAEIPGCQNESACNFDPAATDDDGSCLFVGDACDDGNALTLGDVYTNCALPNFGCQGVGPEVIWKETFEDYGADYGWTQNQSNTASGETEWSIQYGGNTDWFKTVLSGSDLIFEGRDTDFECVWTSREIDVSGHTELQLSAAFSETGQLENGDFVRIEYILDGQTTEIQTLSNDFGTSDLELTAIPDGSTIQLQVVLITNANNERIAFDDVYLFGVLNCLDSDGDGVCNEDDACSDQSACNFSDPAATACLFDDACGVCDGPGAIYECGCSDIPAGDCDCNGNQLDAAGVCGGDCTSDVDQDGVCDTDEVAGCDDPLADNYNPLATDNDGSCTYLPASFEGLVAEAYALNSVADGTHTFRVYAQFSNPNDQLISIYGTASDPLSITSTEAFYQDALGGSTPAAMNPILFPTYPNLEWDSFVTIGSSDNTGAMIQNAGIDFDVFESGGTINSDPITGGSWFVFPDQQPTAFPDADGRVLIGQFTTSGTVTLNCNLQYRASDGTNPQATNLTLVFPNNCPEDINGDGLVAVDDILILLSSFGCVGPTCTGDIDNDGVVGVSDILDVLGSFSLSCF